MSTSNPANGWNVARHLGVQIVVGGTGAVLAYLGHVDWSSLGVYAPIAATLAATATSIYNEVTGAVKGQ